MTAPTTASSTAVDHHATVDSFAAAAAEVASEMWSQVDPDNIVDSWAQQLPELNAVVSGAQLGAARQADPYVAEVLAEQDLPDVSAGQVNPAAFAGVASDGGPLITLLTNPAIVTLLTIADIHDVARAMGYGRANLDMLVRTQVADAGRLAEQVSIASHPGVDGYIRQTDGNPCARCLILAGRRYRWNRGFQRHPRCGCVHLPAGPDVSPLDPQRIYDAMSPRERMRAGFTLADQRALEDGADIFQIVNARHRPNTLLTASGQRPRGLRRAQRTLEGVGPRSRAALFRVDPETGRFIPRLADERPRWTVDEIYRVAGDDRDLAVDLLGEFGYLRGVDGQPTLRDLQVAAREAGVRGTSDMTRRQLVERLADLGEYPAPPRLARMLAEGVGGGARGGLPAGLRAPTLDQLRARVRAAGITVPTGLRRPALVRLADDLERGVPAATARERAVASIVDERRGVADALTRALEADGMSERAMRHVAAGLRRELSADQVKVLRPVLEALDAADSAALRAAVPTVARSAKLRQIGEPGAVARIPGAQVEWIGSARSPVVSVVRPGWETTVERRVVLLEKAAAQAATPEQAALLPAKAAKKAAPVLTPEQRVMRAVPAGLPRQAGAPTLTRAERAALQDYRSSFFTAINGQLRRQDLSESMERIVATIDDVMARSQLTEEIVTWRGPGRGSVFGDRISGDLTGFEWTERAYLSTSVDARQAVSFTRPDVGEMPIVLRVRAPKGTGAVRISPIGDQGEILLERGLTLRVTGDSTTKIGLATVRVLDVEVVPAKAASAKKATAAKKAPAKAAPKAPPAPERMTAPALRRELAQAGVDLDLAAVPKPVLAQATSRLRSGSTAVAERARLRQATIDQQRAAAEALAEAAEILDIGAEALSVRARARLRRIEATIQGWPAEAPVRALVTAMQTGNPAAIRRAIATAERKLKLRPVGAVDASDAFDRSLMSPVGGSIRDGARVQVVRPGYTVEIDGERVVLAKAVVREAREPSMGPKASSLPRLAPPPDARQTALETNPRYGRSYEGPRTKPGVEEGVGYTQNCTRVVIAYEMRRRGLRVTAGAGTPLGDTSAAYIRTFREGGRYATRVARDLSRRMSAREVAAVVESWPPGARGIVTIQGHTLNVERDPVTGKAVFIDAQDTRRGRPTMDLAAFERRARARGAPTDKWVAVARVDDLDLSDYGLHYVEAEELDIADGILTKTEYPRDPDSLTLGTWEDIDALPPDDSYP